MVDKSTTFQQQIEYTLLIIFQ